MAAKKRKEPKKINVRIGKKHRTRKHRVGATHHKAPAKRRKKKHGFLGSTSGSSLGKIAWMAVGVGVGAGLTHVILRPVEAKLMTRWPMIGKFLGAGEIFLGGYIAMKAKSEFVKSVGVGILAGGVHGVMKQVNIYKHIPTVSGSEMSEVRIPISGPLDDAIAGILNDSRRNVYTEAVAGSKYTSVVSNTRNDIDFTKVVAGEFEDASEFFVKS